MNQNIKRIVASSYLGLLLSGCAQFDQQSQHNSEKNQCLHPKKTVKSDATCDLSPWLDYWIASSKQSWSKRHNLLNKLGNDDADIVKTILLSQGSDTPYQQRLRAYYQAQDFSQKYTGKLTEFLSILVATPSLQRLELESAISSLSKLSAQRQEQIQLLRQQLAEQDNKLHIQQQQLEKLLEIEKQLLPENQNDESRP